MYSATAVYTLARGVLMIVFGTGDRNCKYNKIKRAASYFAVVS